MATRERVEAEDAEIVANAKDAIDDVFTDGTVPPKETIERMEELKDHIDQIILTLEEDIRTRNEGW